MMTPTNRREFLAQLSSFGVLLSRPFPMRAQDAIPLRVIPATGESIPVIGFGSTKAVVQIPEAGTDPLRSVMRMLVEYGGRVVDTGPRSEEIDSQFGRLLNEPELRDKLFLATKINTRGREAGIQQMRQAQLTFGRRTMDLIQIQSLTDLEVHWPNLREWKDTGEARYIGVTVSSYNDYERLEAFMRSEPLDFVHLNYSVVETRAEERLLSLAQDRGMAVLINRPFMNGSYFRRVNGRELPEWASEFDCTTWAQFSLKYILAHTTVTCVLTETSNSRHMEENMQAAFGRLPDEATKRRMREVVQGF